MRFPSLILISICFVRAHPSDSNFVEKLLIPDGEVVLRVRIDNKTAVRTSYSGFDLLELAEDDELLRLWFHESELVDCEVETDAAEISNFLSDFDRSYSRQNDACAGQTNISCSDRSKREMRMVAGAEELSPEVAIMMRKQILVEKCSQFQQRHSGSTSNSRKKRSLLFPGTNFCGAGSSSPGPDQKSRTQDNEVGTWHELGLHTSADRCCQEHDSCRHYISPFSWKYQLFNYRVHTVSHCRCDERFRKCLRVARTATANMIGKLFFNVGKTKCFRFKREKACKKRSWWGSCLKKGKVRRAYLTNNSPY